MAKTIFRKIHGRIVPIRINSVKAANAMGFTESRKIIAKIDDHTVGTLDFGKALSSKNSLKVGHVSVSAQFRSNGIAGQMYDHLARLAKRAGIKEIHSTDIISKNALAIREKLGSSFFQRSASGALRKIDPKKAAEIIGDLSSSKTVRAITKIIK